jgi:DNA-binding CsgD family transcriptional regulator
MALFQLPERRFTSKALETRSPVRITLSTADLTAITACARELLSALDDPTPAAWADRVGRSVRPLLRADRSVVSLPTPNGWLLRPTDSALIDAMAAYADHYHQRDVYTNERRRARGLEVFSYDMLITSEEQKQSEFWNDWILRYRACKPIGLALDVAGSPAPAALMGYKDKPNARRFSDRELAILRLLQPSFEAALKTLQRFHAAGVELLGRIDQLARPVALVSPDGAVHANPAFTAVFGARAQSVLDAVTPHARAIVDPRGQLFGHALTGQVQGPLGGPIRWSVHLVSPAGGRTFGLIDFDEPRARVDAASIRARSGLSVRQAEVAVLMARRRTYKEIACALGIQPNTARRHCEQVLTRLGVHSRDEVEALLALCAGAATT